ncbi:hypothetical protein D3C87_1842440 [compost metagenome]
MEPQYDIFPHEKYYEDLAYLLQRYVYLYVGRGCVCRVRLPLHVDQELLAHHDL